MNDYIHDKVWDEITNLFPNSNGTAVEVWKWINNLIYTLLGMWFLIHAGILRSSYVLVKRAMVTEAGNTKLISSIFNSLHFFQYYRTILTCNMSR